MPRQWGTALLCNKAGRAHDKDALSSTTELGAPRVSDECKTHVFLIHFSGMFLTV